MDGLKELVEAFSARIKSPIIGSIALAFVIVNWRPLFFLLFSGESADSKFLFFSCNTTGYSLYLYPVIAGLIFALILPWVNFLGAKAVEAPITRHRNMQLDATHAEVEKKTRQAIDLETANAEYRRVLLESAKVEQDIKDAKIDDDVRGQLEGKFVESKDMERLTDVELGKTLKALPDASIALLMRASEDGLGRVSFGEGGAQYYMKFGAFNVEVNQNIRLEAKDIVSQKAFVIAQEIVEDLVKMEYMKQGNRNAFVLTAKGYSFLENLGGSKPKWK